MPQRRHELGHSGISVVSQATGLSRTMIHQGMKDLTELHEAEVLEKSRCIRAAGGGRKPLEAADPTFLADLEQLVDPVT